jgi:hypothetical protein
MDTTTSDTDREASLEAVRAARRRLAVLAWTLDSAVKLPIVNIRVGLEPLLGFVPVVGDIAGKVLSLYLVAEAWRLSVPGRDLARMLGNAALDAVLGMVPVVGDVFDIFWRANRMNMQILDEHLMRVDPEIVLDPKDWTAVDLARDQKRVTER